MGTGLLMLPVSSQDGSTTDVVTALFTSTSAVCVTGLVVVDTATHWSGFGEAVILALIQVGGFGIMALASLLALLVSGRLRLRMQLTAAAETKSLGLGDVRRVLLGVAGCTLIVELAVGAFLALRLRFGYGRSVAEAAYSGFFHAVSAFNNAGFGLHGDSLTPYAQDPWITLPIAVAVILGGLGFPVLLELLRHRTRRRTTGRRNWSLHTRLTLVTSAALLFIGTVLTCLLEWTNPGTLAPFDWDEKILNGFFYSAMSRTAGFNAIDMGALNATTLLFTCTLMFIGGGSAGTAGGIKVTTFAVLAAAMLAEVRGEPNSTVMVAPRPARAAPGPDRGTARRGPRHRSDPRPVDGHQGSLRSRPLRGRFRVRHRRPVRRHHRRRPRLRPADPRPPHVRRPTRPHHPGVLARPARADPPLPATRGATRHWVTTCTPCADAAASGSWTSAPTPQATNAWPSSALAGSAVHWPTN